MAVKFIVDSASDILPEEAKALGIIHLPIRVMFGEREYADAVDLTHEEFYEKLAQSETVPSTSQVTPADYMDVYEQVVSGGDTAVVITLSSGLSGTYQNAVMAASEYEGKVFVVDSLNATIGQRLVVMKGLEYAKAGLSAAEIKERLDEDKLRIRLIAVIDTLDYLKKGGRISSTVAFVGGLLSIKPLISVVDGKIEVVGKARGTKQAYNQLNDFIKKHGGVNTEEPFAFVYSGNTYDNVKKYLADNPELLADWDGETQICSLGCTIGTHIGSGALGISFFEKQ